VLYQKLKDNYQRESYEIQLKAPLLFWFQWFLMALTVVLLLVDFTTQVSLPRIILHFGILGVIIWSMVSVIRGGYRFSSTLLFTFIYFFLGLLRIIDGYEGPETIGIGVAVMGSFLVFAGLFIQQYKFLIGYTLYAVVVFLYPLIAALTLEPAMRGGLGSVQVLYPSIGFVTIIFSVLSIRRIFDRVLADSLEQLDVMTKKSDQERVILDSSAQQLGKAQELLEYSQETSSSILEIDRNVSSIGQNIQGMDHSVQSTKGILTKMNGAIQDMQDKVAEMINNVTHATAAIEQIVASIQSVGRIITKEEHSVSSLKNKAREGESIVRNTMDAFSQVTGHLDNIRGMTTLISQIAAQTNLLAMNAAIEAAHAGDAGRGFAVVAQEIRKLAESSSVNAKQIGNRLKELIGSIEEANGQVDSTGIFFQEIQGEVESVAIAMGEIRSSAEELNLAGQDILATSSTLTESSGEMEDGIDHLSQSSQEINRDMQELVDISSQINTGMGEITQGVNIINSSVQQIFQLSEELKDHGVSLNQDIAALEEN